MFFSLYKRGYCHKLIARVAIRVFFAVAAECSPLSADTRAFVHARVRCIHAAFALYRGSERHRPYSAKRDVMEDDDCRANVQRLY